MEQILKKINTHAQISKAEKAANAFKKLAEEIIGDDQQCRIFISDELIKNLKDSGFDKEDLTIISDERGNVFSAKKDKNGNISDLNFAVRQPSDSAAYSRF